MMSSSSRKTITIDDIGAPVFTEEQRALMASRSEVELSTDNILAQAVAETGLSDFGPDDFRERLDLWAEAFNADTGLNTFGRSRCWQECVRYAVNRLLLIDIEKRHPEIADIQIDRPLVVIGMPRSGTSNLVNIIAADRRLRSMPLWEALEPLPRPPEVAQGVDNRRQRCLDGWGAKVRVLPYSDAIHEGDPDYIHEDMDLMGANFSNFYPEWMAYPPAWRDYLLARDQTEHYAFAKRFLKAMLFLKPAERWVLKSPSHMENLRAINNVYPDACSVVLHRDPIAVIQSTMTLIAYNDRLRRKQVDVRVTAEYWCDRVERMLQACVDQRSALPESQSVDVMFHDYMADPMGLVHQIYERADIPFTAEAQADIDAFISANPRGKYGQVLYDPIGDFGVDIAKLRKRFEFYYDRFPVQIERVAGESA